MAGRIEQRRLRVLEQQALTHSLTACWRRYHSMSDAEMAEFKAGVSDLDREIISTLMQLDESEIGNAARNFVNAQRRMWRS